jgi:anti-anti-sigma factor
MSSEGSGREPLLLDQIFDSNSLYQLRASVAAHGGDAGMSRARIGDLVVVVHELAANVVRHGSGRGRLIVWRQHDELRCRITDEGPSETPRRASTAAGGSGGSSPRASTAAGGSGGSSPRAGTAATPWRIQPGHGLWLVRKLADGVSVQPGPNGVATTITFSLSAPGPPTRFRLERSTSPAGPILALSGQLDLTSAAELTEAIGELVAGAPVARLILDLAGLTFWDPFGLAALLRAESHVSTGAVGRLVLSDVPEPLLHELRATGLSERFTFADSTQQAIADWLSR